MIQLSELTKAFGDRVLLDHVTWQITDRERVGPVRAERRRQDHAAADDGRARRARLRRHPQAVGADRRLPAAGRPDPRRPHRLRGGHAARSASCCAMKAEMHALEERLGDPSIPEREHEAMLARYSDLQDRFRLRRRLQHRARRPPPCCRGSASARRTSSGRPRRSPAAGRCGSRWPSCCSASPTCCCSTSRPTTSISKRATGSRPI